MKIFFLLITLSTFVCMASPVYELTLPVNGSRIINVQQVQELSFGNLLLAGSGNCTVTPDGTYFVGGSVQITDQPRIGVPGIFVITLGTTEDVPTKTLSMILSTDGKISSSNGRTIPLVLSDIDKKIVFSVVDGKETLTIYIGGTIQLSSSTQQNAYNGTYTINFELI